HPYIARVRDAHSAELGNEYFAIRPPDDHVVAIHDVLAFGEDGATLDLFARVHALTHELTVADDSRQRRSIVAVERVVDDVDVLRARHRDAGPAIGHTNVVLDQGP